MTINISSLTAIEKAELARQLEKERSRELARQRAQRESYEELKDEVVDSEFRFLKNLSASISESKANVFKSFETLLAMKQELYGISDDAMAQQQSHTFTTTDGSRSIQIGHNIVDGWDGEMVAAGVSKVNEWLASKATKDTEMFISIIRDLLRPNKDGMLKASRILELGKKAREHGDNTLIEAVDMLQDAYKPIKTSSFVKACHKNSKGETQWLALSMSQA